MPSSRQNGEGELGLLFSLAALAFLGMTAWLGISATWNYIRTAPTSARIAAQAALVKSLGLPYEKYIDNACEQESTCELYRRFRLECATAGNIKECIKIKMQGSDYSSCGSGAFRADASPLPTYHQCINAKYFGSYDTPEQIGSDSGSNNNPIATKILPPTASASPPTSDAYFWWKCQEYKRPTLASTPPYPDCRKTTPPSATQSAPNPFDRFDASTARLLTSPDPAWTSPKSDAIMSGAPTQSKAEKRKGGLTGYVTLDQVKPPPWDRYKSLENRRDTNKTNSFAALRKAAKAGNNVAEFTLGEHYDNSHNALLAYYWYRKSAEQGNANAQDALGYEYESGSGTRRNYVRANYWYLKSANQGVPDAQLALGFNYSSGNGAPPDPVESYKWFYIAYLSAPSGSDTSSLASTMLKVSSLNPTQKSQARAEVSQWFKAHSRQ